MRFVYVCVSTLLWYLTFNYLLGLFQLPEIDFYSADGVFRTNLIGSWVVVVIYYSILYYTAGFICSTIESKKGLNK